MKNQKVIIYDDTCPMCRWYTRKFVQVGLLEEENRHSFSRYTEKELSGLVDMEKSRDEIPLIDLTGGATLYGVDSLVYILSQRFPVLDKLMRFPFMKGMVKRMYKFISYNRRVIAGGLRDKGSIDCSPNFNLTYRLWYLFIALSLSGVILVNYMYTFLPASAAVIALVAVAMLFVPAFIMKLEDGFNYLGLLLTALLLSSLLLVPALYLEQLAILCGGGALVLGIWQYIKRMESFFGRN